MTNVAKIDRATLIASTVANITPMIGARRERDSAFAEGAQKRSQKYLAAFATEKFAGAAIDYKIDLTDMFQRCDKTLDRFVRVLDSLNRNSLDVTSDRDQNRYTFNLMRTLIGAANASVNVTKSDIFATASKVDDVAEYVNVSSRVMSESTADRQSGIAVFVLEILGFLKRTKNANGSTDYHVVKKSLAYRKVLKIITAA